MKDARILFVILLVGSGSVTLAQQHEANQTQWVRTNLEWVRTVTLKPMPIVDSRRIEAQIEKGCTKSPIRFGDTATMRQQVTPEPMPEEVRRAVSFASFAHDHDTAAGLLNGALEGGQFTAIQRQVLENQLILTAIQFGRSAEARALLERFAVQGDLPASLRSDRLFWSVLAAGNQSPKAWERDLLPRLDAALEADPTSFQVLSWRVLGWMRAKPWEEGARHCPKTIRDFSDRILDLSEAGACPLMLGHLAFALDRDLAEQVVRQVPPDMASWRHFALGILAVVVGDRAVHKQAMADLFPVRGDASCAAPMISELSQLEDRFGGTSGE